MQTINIELLRQSEHHMKIPYRQQLLLPCLNPFFSLCTLAFRAMSVTATIITDADMSATVALICMSTQCSRSAISDGIQHTQVHGRWLVLCDKSIPELTHNMRQFIRRGSHLTTNCIMYPVDCVRALPLPEPHASTPWWSPGRYARAGVVCCGYRYRLQVNGWQSCAAGYACLPVC
jgi:hypothetical protein